MNKEKNLGLEETIKSISYSFRTRLSMDKAYYKPGTRIKFRCIRCDVCCGTGPNVTITIYDLIRISKRLGVHPRAVLEQFMNVVIADVIPYITLGSDQWGRCVFLGFNQNGETYCRIYDARPYKCRVYPAQLGGLSEELKLDLKCPGLDKGEETEIASSKDVQILLDETKRHYEKILELVLTKKLEPLRALYEAIDNEYRMHKQQQK